MPLTDHVATIKDFFQDAISKPSSQQNLEIIIPYILSASLPRLHRRVGKSWVAASFRERLATISEDPAEAFHHVYSVFRRIHSTVEVDVSLVNTLMSLEETSLFGQVDLIKKHFPSIRIPDLRELLRAVQRAAQWRDPTLPPPSIYTKETCSELHNLVTTHIEIFCHLVEKLYAMSIKPGPPVVKKKKWKEPNGREERRRKHEKMMRQEEREQSELSEHNEVVAQLLTLLAGYAVVLWQLAYSRCFASHCRLLGDFYGLSSPLHRTTPTEVGPVDGSEDEDENDDDAEEEMSGKKIISGDRLLQWVRLLVSHVDGIYTMANVAESLPKNYTEINFSIITVPQNPIRYMDDFRDTICSISDSQVTADKRIQTLLEKVQSLGENSHQNSTLLAFHEYVLNSPDAPQPFKGNMHCEMILASLPQHLVDTGEGTTLEELRHYIKHELVSERLIPIKVRLRTS